MSDENLVANSAHPAGDWYCRNCGYLCAARVTHSETCDTCHQPVEWHALSVLTELDRLRAEIDRLRAENAMLTKRLAWWDDPLDYSIAAHWDEERGVFVARVIKFPACVGEGDTPDEAIAAARRRIPDYVRAIQEIGAGA